MLTDVSSYLLHVGTYVHECSAGVHDFTYSAAAVPSYLHVGTYNALHITWTALLPLPGRHSYCSAADERPFAHSKL